MSRFLMAFLMVLTVISCGLTTTRNILPVAEPDVIILPRSRGLAAAKDKISVIVVPLQDVKELDAFGVMIVNETPNWLSFRKEDCVLFQSGEARYPLTDAQASSRLGSGYKAKLPDELNVDIFEWRQGVNVINSRDLKIVDEDKKISIMSGTKEKAFLYYKTRDDTSPMQLIFSNIYNETTNQRTRFSFKFAVEKK